MLAIERARAQLPESTDLSQIETRLTAAEQNYSRLLDAPVTSLEAFSAEASQVRYDLGKVYAAINQALEAAKRARVLWAAVGVTLALTASLAWGWFNAQKSLRNRQPAVRQGFLAFVPRALFLLLVFTFFALPIFRLPSQAVTMTSPEAQERQTRLDESARAAQTADRALSRAWAFAQIGALQAQSDPAQGNVFLQEALSAARESQHNAAALWGLSQSAWEAGGADSLQADAALVAADLEAMRGRAWGLRLIAESWIDSDPARAAEILAEAMSAAESGVPPYDELDLRAIAVTWARLDLEGGLAVARRISDPALRSWALREIAHAAGDAALLSEAAQSARLATDPVQRARALCAVAVAAGDDALFQEAAQVLQEATGAAQAYALAELAAASGDLAAAALISAKYPTAQTLAYFYLGDYENAWQATAAISDPFEQARAQAAIAAGWANRDAAVQIATPLLRDRALRDVSLKTGDPSLVEAMHDSYYQVQTLTAAGHIEEAWQKASTLKEGYPLIALGTSWAKIDPQAAMQVADAMKREADKAIVLRAIAVATNSPVDFERALGMAMAARVRNDALSPVQASLDLARAFAGSPAQFQAAVSQAYEAALKINIIY
jgi:hypothetical protein